MGSGLWQDLKRWWSAALAAGRTRRQLHALSDHILKDIGIDRAMIDGRFR